MRVGLAGNAGAVGHVAARGGPALKCCSHAGAVSLSIHTCRCVDATDGSSSACNQAQYTTEVAGALIGAD